MPLTIVPFLKKVSLYILNPLLEVLFGVATIYLIWSVIKLISADGKDKAGARDAVMWALVGMFIMVSVYGIINFIFATFDLPSNASQTYLQGK